MEKKLKFSEFAELIGTTAKTVYKMKERNEIMTVSERVNNRLTMLVVTNDEQIQKFKSLYSKTPFNNGYYEDFVTINNDTMNENNYSQTNNSNEMLQEMFDRIISINDEYNNRIAKLNEELIDSKSKMLILEDKANREGLYIKEINELKTENEQLRTSKNKSLNALSTVIVILLMFIVGFITYTVGISTRKEQVNEEITQTVEQIDVNVKSSAKPIKQQNRKR